MAWPTQKFVKLKGLTADELEGRISVYESAHKFESHVDIIVRESGKIYKHITVLFGCYDSKEAFSLGYYELKKYLKSLEKV